MTSMLEGSLRKTIGKAMFGLFLPAVLIRMIRFGDDINDLLSPHSDGSHFGDDTQYIITLNSDPFDPDPALPHPYSCRAIHENWSAYHLSAGLVNASDRKVIILASTLAAIPQPNDQIIIRGETFTIVSDGAGQPSVESDPALATWTIRARK